MKIRFTVFSVFTIALAVRGILFLLSYALDSNFIYMFDSYGYLQIAHNMRDFGIFSISNDKANLFAEFNRTPGYPLLLALFIKHPMGEWFLLTFQIVLSALLPVLLFLIGKTLKIKQKNLVFAVLLGVASPALIYNSYLVLTDGLFAFCLMLGFYWLLRGKQLIYFLGAALFLTFAIALRPVGFFPVLVLLFWQFFRGEGTIKKAVFLLLPLLFWSGWSMRNYHYTQSFFYSNIMSINLLFYNVASVEAQLQDIDFNTAQLNLRKEVDARFDLRKNEDITAFNAHCKQRFIASFFEQPGIHLKFILKNMAIFFVHPVQVFFIKNPPNWFAFIFKATQVAIYFVLFIGMFYYLLRLEKRPLKWVLLLLIFYFALSTGTTLASHRFRIAVEVFLILFGVSGINNIIGNLKLRSGKQ